MKNLVSLALSWAASKLDGRKTYLAAAGLAALAVYQFSQSQFDSAAESLLAALAAVGLRSAVAKSAAPAVAAEPEAK